MLIASGVADTAGTVFRSGPGRRVREGDETDVNDSSAVRLGEDPELAATLHRKERALTARLSLPCSDLRRGSDLHLEAAISLASEEQHRVCIRWRAASAG